MPEIPTAPAAKACFDNVQEHAPLLWSALQERILPLAGEAERGAAERIRDIRAAGQEAWRAFMQSDPAASYPLGKSWPCAIEDVVAAVAIEAAGSAAREELEQVLAALQEAPPGMLSTTRATMRVRSALAS